MCQPPSEPFSGPRFHLHRTEAVTDVVADDDLGVEDTDTGKSGDEPPAQQLTHDVVLARSSEHSWRRYQRESPIRLGFPTGDYFWVANFGYSGATIDGRGRRWAGNVRGLRG